jgi:hypothetical protein
MIDYILYGEFDINEGNVIKVEFPNKIGINETVLASYLIPEGTHNFTTDCFCFILNKKLDYEKYLYNSINSYIDRMNLNQIKYLDLSSKPSVLEKNFQVKKLYNFNLFNNQWESLNLNEKEHLFFRIRKGKEIYFNILIEDSKGENFFSM